MLVTGCSSGIGRDAVPRLRDAGCTVVATARRVGDIEDLAGDGVEVLPLDVTDEAARRRAVDEVQDRFGRIDRLVNNAGFGAGLPIEETPLETMRGIFEVNLFGLHRLTQMVLPGMRARGEGRIVNVSSVAGHLSFPMIGAYCASKSALRAYTQALHVEVRPFGLHAALVEPGRIATRFSERSQAERARAQPHPEGSPYAALYARWQGVGHGGGADPRVIGRRIVRACTERRPRFHYIAPWDAKLGVLARRLLPDAWLNAGLAAYFRHEPEA